MVVGVALNFFGVMKVAACLFLLGAVCFGGMQLLQTYEGRDVAIRRLRRIMTPGRCAFHRVWPAASGTEFQLPDAFVPEIRYAGNGLLCPVCSP